MTDADRKPTRLFVTGRLAEFALRQVLDDLAPRLDAFTLPETQARVLVADSGFTGYRVAKRVRTETGISRGHVSVSSAAVDYVRQVFDHFGDKTILVIGAGKMGELVAAPIVNAYDDGALPNGWGSQAFDDEGVPTQKTRVIEDGRLTGYLYDRLRAREAGAAPTGNGRRQSFRHVPIPRMTTTYIGAGDATADEIIAATSHGFYAKSLAGGQVEPASGNFVFGVAEGYLIENGRITAPLRGATLVGNGIDILMRIDMIAADFDVKTGVCGKDGQGVPVGTGQATLRIAEMTVGGTG